MSSRRWPGTPGCRSRITDARDALAPGGGWGEVPPPPWDALAALLRELLGELTTFPLAAVTVQLAGAGATLAHLGTEPIELDLSGAQVRAVRWEVGVAVGTWQAEVQGPGSVNAGPGWAYSLPFDH